MQRLGQTREFLAWSALTRLSEWGWSVTIIRGLAGQSAVEIHHRDLYPIRSQRDTLAEAAYDVFAEAMRYWHPPRAAA
jgi:hypothetical protein